MHVQILTPTQNRPRVPVHNNNRDGAGQMMIPFNKIAYSENSLNNGSPKEANQTHGNGFFTAPARRIVDAAYVRDISPTFLDYWTQPRLLFNSLLPAEQQMVVNAARFELSKISSMAVREASIAQFNKISNDLAKRVAKAVGVAAPQPNPQYYHDNKTAGISVFSEPLPTIATLKVGILVSTSNAASLSQAAQIAEAFKAKGAVPVVIGEVIQSGVDQTYSASDAVLFDGIIVVDGTKSLFSSSTASSLYPPQRPTSIIRNAFLYGKPVGAIGDGEEGLKVSSISARAGVYINGASTATQKIVDQFEEGLKTFKFLDRFATD